MKMSEHDIIKLKEIADKEIMSSLFYTDLSLANGQMGVAIFFALLSRFFKNKYYEEFAEELLDNLCNNISVFLPVTFANGLCGIGWGIEFLKYQGFINDDTDEILSEIDYEVMQKDLKRISDDSLETGLYGIMAYVYSRINSKRECGNHLPFDSDYIYTMTQQSRRFDINSSEYFSVPNIWKVWTELNSHLKLDSWKSAVSKLPFIIIDGGMGRCF